MKIKSGVIIGEIIRVQKTKNFALMDKGFFEDENLSWKGKGILGYLLTKPDQWKVIVADLIKRSKDGRDSVYAGLKELKEHGYYSKKPVRNEKGVITHWESVVYESPLENPEYMTFCPLTAFPDTAKAEHSNNNYNNNYNKSKSISDKIQELSERIVGTFAKEKTDMIGCDNTPNPSVDVKEKSSNVIFASLPATEDTEELNTVEYSNSDYNYTKTAEIVNSDFEKTVKENVNYDRLLEEKVAEKPIIDSFVKIMVDTFKDNSAKNFFNKEVIKDVNGTVVTLETLKDVFSKANFEHLKYTIISFVKSSRRIKKSNIVKYIKTAIYRNFFTYELAKANEECVANAQSAEQNTQPAYAPTYQRPARKNRFINYTQSEWDFDKIKELEEEYIENHVKDYKPSERAKEHMRQNPTFGLPSFS